MVRLFLMKGYEKYFIGIVNRKSFAMVEATENLPIIYKEIMGIISTTKRYTDFVRKRSFFSQGKEKTGAIKIILSPS